MGLNAELNLKSQTGAWIVAVQRGEEIFANPSSDFVLNEGDMIVMLGKRDEIEKAIEFLDEI
ncbi:TrkA C-terminal domain-containing protein [Candidatus Chrysopegis kryptomonas]|uniref:cation:proton antiporter regulatory subunit n=1 Tax=Candidatus Chryseopegocella kryptomonas TaxID=1633643 RepID=UPI000B8066D6